MRSRRIRDRVRIKRLGVWRRRDKSPVFYFLYLFIILCCENKDHARILFKCDVANSGQTTRKIKICFSSNDLISLKKYIIPTKFQPESLSLPVFFLTYYSCISLPFIWNSTRQEWEQPFKSSPTLTREWWFIKLNILPTNLLTNRCPYRTVLKWSAECMEKKSALVAVPL